MPLQSVTIDEEAETITIVLGLEKKPKASTTGKSLIIASSGGRSVSTGVLVNAGGKDVQISAVAYIAK